MRGRLIEGMKLYFLRLVCILSCLSTASLFADAPPFPLNEFVVLSPAGYEVQTDKLMRDRTPYIKTSLYGKITRIEGDWLEFEESRTDYIYNEARERQKQVSTYKYWIRIDNILMVKLAEPTSTVVEDAPADPPPPAPSTLSRQRD